MGNESVKPPQVPEKSEPAKKHDDAQNKFFWEFVEQLSSTVKLIRAYIKRDGKAIWDGWIFFGILAIVIAYYAPTKGYDYGTKTLEKKKTEFQETLNDAKDKLSSIQGE